MNKGQVNLDPGQTDGHRAGTTSRRARLRSARPHRGR